LCRHRRGIDGTGRSTPAARAANHRARADPNRSGAGLPGVVGALRPGLVLVGRDRRDPLLRGRGIGHAERLGRPSPAYAWGSAMSLRQRILLATGLSGLLLVVAVVYVVVAGHRASAPAVAAATVDASPGPRILFRSTAPDSMGRAATVAADSAAGPRTVSAV